MTIFHVTLLPRPELEARNNQLSRGHYSDSKVYGCPLLYSTFAYLPSTPLVYALLRTPPGWVLSTVLRSVTLGTPLPVPATSTSSCAWYSVYLAHRRSRYPSSLRGQSRYAGSKIR